jgi:thioredoxin-like negative regulator of GroEL
MLKDITPQMYEEIIDLKGTGLIVIGSETCRTCMSMKLVFDEILSGQKINVVKLDSDKYYEYVTRELFIEALPSFIIVEHGEVTAQLSGELTADELRNLVKRITG